MATPISVSSAADVLAYVPHSLTFQPTESFVFITLRGKSIGALLRLDVPAEATPVDYAQTVTHYLLSDTEADGTLMIAYTDQEGTAVSRPYAGHADALSAEFEDAGIPLRDSWIVTAHGWTTYFCQDADCCPVKALSEIADSRLNAEFVFRGSAVSAAVEPADPACTGRGENTAVIARLAATWEKQTPEEFGPEDCADGVVYEARTAWAETLTHGLPDEDTAILLISYFQPKNLRDRLLADIISTDEDPEVFRAVLIGSHPERPDWTSVDAGEALLIHLLTFAPGQSRAPLFCALAWISWYKGQSSLGHAYCLKALGAASGYRLADLFGRMISSGLLAEVCRNKDTAYQRPAD